ncbi:MAG: hypothetical protein B7X34_04690 [Acidobacteriia bacterium 12-62-4]|nr:MAG: hypothetical protein B7X34_04690 [Acidobacteriia bacterium 12-62-4]
MTPIFVTSTENPFGPSSQPRSIVSIITTRMAPGSSMNEASPPRQRRNNSATAIQCGQTNIQRRGRMNQLARIIGLMSTNPRRPLNRSMGSA